MRHLCLALHLTDKSVLANVPLGRVPMILAAESFSRIDTYSKNTNLKVGLAEVILKLETTKTCKMK